MKKIKVALIYSTNGFGGMVTNIAKIVNCLHRDDFEVILISIEANNPVALLIDQELSTKVMELGCRGRLDFQTLNKLRKILLEEEVGILSLHGYKANFYGLFSSFNLKLKRISTIHGWVSQSLKLKCYQYLDKLLVFKFDEIIAVSPAQLIRHPYLKLIRHRITVIENAIDINEMSISLEQQLEKEKNVIILGTSSRLEIEKRVHVLILACSKLKVRNWKFLILGDGSERQNLERLSHSLGLSEEIIFLGYQKNVKPFLHYFDIFLSASSIEGLPNSLLEAGACDNAVIVSDIVEHSTVVQDKINGLHFPLDNVTILAERIADLIENQDLRDTLALNLKQHLIEHYSLGRREKMFNSLFLKAGTS